jgi:8-oxo-dGTP diphosphatase
VIEVSCAVMLYKDKILAVKRGQAMKMAGLWEFPGGKVEKGESYSVSLVREIHEELGVTIAVAEALTPVEWSYPSGPHIRLHPYFVHLSKCAAEGIDLKEHDELKWLEIDALWSVCWADADVPIVKEVLTLLSKS